MIGILGILLSLGLLMWLAYRGITVLVLAPLLAILAVLIGGDLPLLAVYTQVFMTALGGFVVKYFPLFLLGAILGRLTSDSGSADTIAQAIVARLGAGQALPAVVLACAALTYGGVSLFVVAFAAYPVAATLFRQAAIPKRLIPGAIALGAATFTMTALPGAPSIQNAIPMPYLGTDLFAAPLTGLAAGGLMLAGGLWWLQRRQRTAADRQEGYGDHAAEVGALDPAARRPSLLVALAPLVLVVAGNFVFARLVIPAMDTSYLAEARFGGVTLDDVRGMWALIAALSLAIVATIALHAGSWRSLADTINQGTRGSLLPIFNTASEVAYGTVIASLAAFALIRDQVLGLWPAVPLVSASLAVNVMAGITGSASGGLGIALAALGTSYLDLIRAAGVSPEVLHRVVVMASGGLDSLPHNGAVITLLGICGVTHRESYADIFVVSVVVPVLTLALVLLVGSVGGLF
jgi:H+/gluconate symporter-like permease